MKFLVVALIVCIAFIAVISAAPLEESIPEGINGAASETSNPSDDQSIFHKLLLLKLLLLG